MLGLVTAFIAPAILYKYLFKGKYRGVLLIRLGLKRPIIPIEEGQSYFWVHAVSLGEAKAATLFVQQLQQNYPQTKVVFSCLTTTGLSVAKQIPGVIPLILPQDYLTKGLIKQVNPKAIFFVEGDLWPNMLDAKCPIYVLNGKISQKTAWILSRFSFVKQLLIEPVRFWCVQSDLVKDRLELLGVEPAKIAVTTDIKMSLEPVVKQMQYPEGILVISTHPKEEELLMEQLLQLNKIIYLAPRHPERCKEVEQNLEKSKISFCRYGETLRDGDRVYLINKVGVLADFFYSCPVTIMGGSFIENIGGHNLVEPILYGSVPFYGPHIFKQLHLHKILQNSRLDGSTTIETLANDIQEKIFNPINYCTLQQAIEVCKKDWKRPLEQTCSILFRLLNLS